MTDAKKEPAAEWVPRASLKPWGRNPRKNDPAVQRVVASIRAYGWGAPIVARLADRRIIAGHTRWKAAEVLALDPVPCRFVDVSESIADQMALADNRLGEIAEWDDAELLKILQEFTAEEVTVAGFSLEDLDRLLEESSPKAPVEDVEPQVDKAEELRQKWGVERGQMWALGEHRILCGDSTKAEDVERVMGGDRADLLVTDPPYGVAVVGGTKDPRDTKNFQSGNIVQNDALSDADLETLVGTALANAAAVMKPGAAYYVWHPSSKVELFARCVRTRLAPHREVVIWSKPNFVFGRQDYHWRHEPCFYGWLEGAAHKWLGSRDQSTVWEVEKVGEDLEKKVHPTAKPTSLVAIPINNHTLRGDVLYEPFSGSGTTLLACEQLGRRCRAIEIDPGYVAVAIQRWVDATGGEPRRLDGGEK